MIPSFTRASNNEQDKAKERAERVARWAEVLSRVNFGIKGKSTPVLVVDSLPAPAMTDGHGIKFDGPYVANLFSIYGNNRAVTNVLGLNYHELSHTEFSPSPVDSALVTRLKYRAKERHVEHGVLFQLCNMVEDQRIESLFSARYANAGNYFTVLLNDVIIAPAAAQPEAVKAATYFKMTVGRVYLPAKMRRAIRAEFVKHYDADLANEISRIIRAYCRLNLLKSVAVQRTAGDLIAELYDVLVDAGLLVGSRDNTGHNWDTPGHDGNPAPGQDPDKSDKADEAADAVSDAFDEMDDEDSGAGEGEGPADGDDGDGAGSEDGDGDADGDTGADADGAGAGEGDGGDEGESPAEPAEQGQGGVSSDDDADDADDADGDDADGGGPEGPGRGAGTGDGEQSFNDAIADSIEDVLNDENLREQNEELSRAVSALPVKGTLDWSSPAVDHHRSATAQPAENNTRLGVKRVLAQMKADAGSVWERRVDFGRRINVVAFHDREPWDTNFFDHYDDGAEDEFDMEVVILLDQSGSMSWQMRSASVALWAIRDGFTSVGARVWGIGYNSRATPLFKPGSRMSPSEVTVYGCGGGTYAKDALTEARAVFDRSSAHSKILLAITDGDWSDASESETLIRLMNDDGVHTIYAHLDAMHAQRDLSGHPAQRHYCHTGHFITDPSDLVHLMERFVVDRATAR